MTRRASRASWSEPAGRALFGKPQVGDRGARGAFLERKEIERARIAGSRGHGCADHQTRQSAGKRHRIELLRAIARLGEEEIGASRDDPDVKLRLARE